MTYHYPDPNPSPQCLDAVVDLEHNPNGCLDGVVVVIRGGRRRVGPGSDPHFAVDEAHAIAHELAQHAIRILRGLPFRHGNDEVESICRRQNEILRLIKGLFDPPSRQDLGALSVSDIANLIDNAIDNTWREVSREGEECVTSLESRAGSRP